MADDRPVRAEKHPVPGEPHSAAGEDHPAAGEDHPAAGEDHPAAGEDHPVPGDRRRRRNTAQAGEQKHRHHDRHQDSDGLRDLVGAGPSQLGVSKALRGRDVNRPTEDDLAEAERSVTIVRRNWRPPN